VGGRTHEGRRGGVILLGSKAGERTAEGGCGGGGSDLKEGGGLSGAIGHNISLL